MLTERPLRVDVRVPSCNFRTVTSRIPNKEPMSMKDLGNIDSSCSSCGFQVDSPLLEMKQQPRQPSPSFNNFVT